MLVVADHAALLNPLVGRGTGRLAGWLLVREMHVLYDEFGTLADPEYLNRPSDRRRRGRRWE